MIDQRYEGYNKINLDKEYFIIGVSQPFLLSDFEFQRKSDLIKRFRDQHLRIGATADTNN